VLAGRGGRRVNNVYEIDIMTSCTHVGMPMTVTILSGPGRYIMIRGTGRPVGGFFSLYCYGFSLRTG
jgi:hypothetical protein